MSANYRGDTADKWIKRTRVKPKEHMALACLVGVKPSPPITEAPAVVTDSCRS